MRSNLAIQASETTQNWERTEKSGEKYSPFANKTNLELS